MESFMLAAQVFSFHLTVAAIVMSMNAENKSHSRLVTVLGTSSG